jgi:hypothetical protein
MYGMTYTHHRIRRDDQNQLFRRPLDHWSPWIPFPSFDFAMQNAYRHAMYGGWTVQLETGEVLVSHTKEVDMQKLALTKAGTPDGTKDPYVPGMVLVPLTRQHSTLPTVTGAPAESFYRYDPRKRRVECIVSILRGGLAVAWDTCGGCAMHVRACKCTAIKPSRGVAYLAEMADDNPPVNTWEGKPLKFRPQNDNAKALPLEKSPEPFVRTLPKVEPKETVEVNAATSLSDFDNEAEKLATSGTQKLLKALGARTPAVTPAKDIPALTKTVPTPKTILRRPTLRPKLEKGE